MEGPRENEPLDLSALIARVRFHLAMMEWKRREAFFRRRTSWAEIVFGGRRRARRDAEGEEE